MIQKNLLPKSINQLSIIQICFDRILLYILFLGQLVKTMQIKAHLSKTRIIKYKYDFMVKYSIGTKKYKLTGQESVLHITLCGIPPFYFTFPVFMDSEPGRRINMQSKEAS